MNVEERIISILRQKAENYMPSFYYNIEEEEIKKSDAFCAGSAMTFLVEIIMSIDHVSFYLS